MSNLQALHPCNTDPEDLRFRDLVIRFLDGELSTQIVNYVYADDPTGQYPIKGSEQWDKMITQNTAYYPYQNEIDLIQTEAILLAKAVQTSNSEVPIIFDFGPGSENSVKKKTIEFLKAFQAVFGGVARYIPIDLSPDCLDQTVKIVREEFSDLIIEPRCEDFYEFDARQYQEFNVVGLFPGSTIGNTSEPHFQARFENTTNNLAKFANVIGPNNHFLIGYDANNDEKSLLEAYNHPLYHAHCMYILDRIKWQFPEFGIEPKNFNCKVEWVAQDHRVSYYAVNKADTIVPADNKDLNIFIDQALHIGSSYKYPVPLLTQLGQNAGLHSMTYVQDKQKRMTLQLFRKLSISP